MAGVRVPPGAPTHQCLQSLSQHFVASHTARCAFWGGRCSTPASARKGLAQEGEAGMARSLPASATFCSPCSQAAEPNLKPLLRGCRHRDFQSHELACCGADLRTRGVKRGPSVGSPLEPASHSRVSRNGMPRLRATYKGRDAESSPQVHTTRRGLWLVSALAQAGAFQRLPRTDIRWP